MLILPTDGGSVPGWWIGFGYAPVLRARESGLDAAGAVRLLGSGSAPPGSASTIQADRLEREVGVPLRRLDHPDQRRHLRALRPLRGAGAALYLTTQTGAGSPTIGKDYILPSVAAAVIGGVSLFGGRGGLAGTMIGAFILTLIGNLVFVLRVSSYWQPVAVRRHPAASPCSPVRSPRKPRASRASMSTFFSRNRADPARLSRHGRAAAGHRAVLARLPLASRTSARPSSLPPSSASSRSARPSSSSAAASTCRCPGC